MSDFSRREFLKLTGATGLATGFSGLILPSSLMAKTNGRVVIVGGGFGGATCANYIKRYGPNIDVTLVEPSKKFVTCPFSNTVIGGLKTMDSMDFKPPMTVLLSGQVTNFLLGSTSVTSTFGPYRLI